MMSRKQQINFGWRVFLLTVTACIIVFYFGYYKYFLSTNSTSFALERAKYEAKNHHDATIIVLGDSTAACDFQANYFNKKLPGEKAVNLGVPGTWLFTYHKLALFGRDKLPRAKTVILLLGPDTFSKGNKQFLIDMEYNKTALCLGDIKLVHLYSHSFKDLTKGVFLLAFRPALFGRDLHNLILHPFSRIREAMGTNKCLRRKVSLNDPLWEEDRIMNVTGIDDLDKLPEMINLATDPKEVERLKWIQGAYQVRKAPKTINPDFILYFHNLLQDLSRRFDNVYIVNSPIYVKFDKAYDHAYLDKIQNLTATMCSLYPNVQYVALDDKLISNPENFMDVVHLNKTGGMRLSEHLAKKINTSGTRTITLIKFGPESVKTGQLFNVQPNGESAVWVEAENITPDTIVVVNGKQIKSFAFPEKRLVTAIVPKNIYEKTGQYSFYLLDKATGRKSNEKKFTVLPE